MTAKPSKPVAVRTLMDFTPQQRHAVTNLEEVLAVSALLKEGGHDLLFATVLMDVIDFGWPLWEMRIHELNAKHKLQTALPSWIISTLRHQMRTELVLCSYGMVPLHGVLIGQALNHTERLTRLVIQHNSLRDVGTSAIAEAIAQNSTLQEVHLVGCEITDQGATALGHAMRSNCSIRFLHLAQNRIGDVGVQRLAEGIAANPRAAINELQLGDNPVRPESMTPVLHQIGFSPRSHGVYLRTSRPAPGTVVSAPPPPVTTTAFRWSVSAPQSDFAEDDDDGVAGGEGKNTEEVAGGEDGESSKAVTWYERVFGQRSAMLKKLMGSSTKDGKGNSSSGKSKSKTKNPSTWVRKDG
jgi:hypothetical protein